MIVYGDVYVPLLHQAHLAPLRYGAAGSLQVKVKPTELSHLRPAPAAEAVFVIGREVREENASLTWILARKDVAVLEADSRARRARPVVRTNGIRRAIEWASIQRRPPAVPAGVGHRVASGVTGAIRGAHALVANTGAIARSVQGVTHLTRRAGTRMAGGAAESVAAIAGLDAGTV